MHSGLHYAILRYPTLLGYIIGQEYRMKTNKPVIYGVAGSIGLIVFYMAVLWIAESFQHAIWELLSSWYWILLLSLGFGTQLGLWSFMRMKMKQRSIGTTVEVAASGGVSAGAMIACCAHHIADLLPVLGLSAAAVFFTTFRSPFIVLGLFSNVIGIMIMLGVMRKRDLYPDNRFFAMLGRFNKRGTRTVLVTGSALTVVISFVLTAASAEPAVDPPPDPGLDPTAIEESGVSFEVTPIDFTFGEPLELEVLINTHVGDLDFEVDGVSSVVIDDTVEFNALSWTGSPPGGHHRSGTLTFPSIPPTVSKLELKIRDVYGVPVRKFIWNLE